MPYSIEQRDGEYCVIKDDDGESMGCHSTRDDAEGQRRAIEANEESARVREYVQNALDLRSG